MRDDWFSEIRMQRTGTPLARQPHNAHLGTMSDTQHAVRTDAMPSAFADIDGKMRFVSLCAIALAARYGRYRVRLLRRHAADFADAGFGAGHEIQMADFQPIDDSHTMMPAHIATRKAAAGDHRACAARPGIGIGSYSSAKAYFYLHSIRKEPPPREGDSF